MKNIQSIDATLIRMAELLRLGGRIDWANALEKHHNEIASEPNATKGRILTLYGGMGSLNDIVIYSNGSLLVKENNELNALRSKLYELCHSPNLGDDTKE